MAAAIATAIARPTGRVARAIRSTFRPPATNATSTLATGTKIESTSRNPPAVCHIRKLGWIRHHSWMESVALPATVSALSVSDPVSSKSRSKSATASAVPAAATTIPVMTSACGTGSPLNAVPAPLRATTPKNRKTPLLRRLKARIFRKRLRIHNHPVEAETRRPRAAEAEYHRRGHGPGSLSDGPAISRASVTATVNVIANSIARSSGLA